MNYKLGKRSLRILTTVHSDLEKIAHRAIQLTPIDFGIPSTGGYRSPEEQHELFLDGASKCDGYTRLSNHQSGNALDFYAYIDGRANWDRENLALIACAFLQAANQLGIKLQWGGLWENFVDMPHIELA